MPRKSKQTTLFVIFARPQQPARSGTRYIAKDGSTTPIKSRAARFWTYWEAKAFAEESHLALNAFTYIDREDFRDRALRGYGKRFDQGDRDE